MVVRSTSLFRRCGYVEGPYWSGKDRQRLAAQCEPGQMLGRNRLCRAAFHFLLVRSLELQLPLPELGVAHPELARLPLPTRHACLDPVVSAVAPLAGRTVPTSGSVVCSMGTLRASRST
jgi:hypothetical protein